MGLWGLPKCATGQLAIIGGRLEADNDTIFEEMKRLSGGKIAVFPTASEIAEEVGLETVTDFRRYGFEAEMIGLFWNNCQQTAFDRELIARVEALGSVYFTGGDQSRIVNSLIQADQETPMLQIIRHLHRNGGLVAGSSAGAAMMSQHIITSGTSLESLVDGLVASVEEPGLTLGTGLNFFPWGLVDQHFIKRGRIGRLLVAMQQAGCTYGFGVDENTGMFVEGDWMTVRGETGAIVVDLSQAQVSADGGEFSGVSFSYLDDGDSYDLRRHRPQKAPDKIRLRVTPQSYTTPAPFQRNAFGSYALHDLMIRLIQGNPRQYRRDAALAYDARHETEVIVELERLPRRSRALIAERHGEARYSAFNLQLNITRKRISQRAWRDFQVQTNHSLLNGGVVAPEARLVVLGSAPLSDDGVMTATLLRQLAPPVGIIATAAYDPRATARDYRHWLARQGIEDVEDLEITLHNIERQSLDEALLERIAAKRTLIFTGGNQRRLVETLLHRGETSPVLRAIVHAYKQGATLIAVSGAASAICTRMIAEGDSYDALRFGASNDAGHEGMVIEEGFGLFTLGIVDQNFIHRRRLGRLIVACAEQGCRYGFGLCEQSGMVLGRSGQPIHAFGRHGFVVVALDPSQLAVDDKQFCIRDVKLHFVQPGEAFDPVQGCVLDAREPALSGQTVERIVLDLARECGASLGEELLDDLRPGIRFALQPNGEGSRRLAINSPRIRQLHDR